MQKAQFQEWKFPLKKQLPFSLLFNPQMMDLSSQFMNPFLGYPNCPLIGRYNQGQYRIAQTQCHLQFQCKFQEKQQEYKCGLKKIHLPEKIVQNLRNIPEIIKHNKPALSKNQKIQNIHPQSFPISNDMSFYFMITFGQIGKDFLNYLNHMYTLAQDLFIDQKLRRSVHLLPIYAYLPQKSGIRQQQVDKGLCLQNYRSEYMSLHLKYGAPAFSPNNMRLGVEGMKKIQSNPPGKNKKKYKQKNQENKLNQKFQENKQEKQQKIQNIEQDFKNFEFQPTIQQKSQQKQQPKTSKPKTQVKNGPHKGFVHIYTSMLLKNDYRVYYHWHIENPNRKQLIYAALMSSKSLLEFISSCQSLLGFQDQCVLQLKTIFA